MSTFVVERYWPGISVAEAEGVLECEARAAQEMRAEGRAIHVLRTTLVEQDETLLSIVEAESELDVAELGVRAGRPADRIVPGRDMAPGLEAAGSS